MSHLGEKIARRRAELNLTDWDLAHSIGLHLSVLWRLEDSGSIDSLSLAQVDSLESRLGLPLLDDRAFHKPPAEGAQNDAKAIGALLRAVEGEGRWTRDDLAIGLGWNLPRMTAATEALDKQLRNSGLMLAIDAGGVMSIAALETPVLVVDALPAGDDELQLSDEDLEIVLDLADLWHQRQRRPIGDFTEEDRKRIARMLKLGILDHANGVLAISAVTAEALDPILQDTRPYIGWSRRPSARMRTS